uniref:Uncharacterized protein n=1 Tax=Heliothis virescens TaxID=7102 RepID=A0A2A4JW67_HELVI
MASTCNVSGLTLEDKNTPKLCKAGLEAIRAEFNETLRNIVLLSTERTEFDKSKLFSKFYLNNLIDNIREEKNVARLRENYVNKYQDTLEVGTSRNGNEQLLVKDQGLFKLFPAWQDIFDTLWPLHLEHDHPSPELMKYISKDYYIIQNFAIELLNDVCCVCLGEDKPFVRCAVYILEMDPRDNAFDRIMVYEELHTGFIHMAPMTSDTMVSEMSLELLRLFMDYGPPKKLFINDRIVETSVQQVRHLTQFAPFNLEIKPVRLDLAYMNRLKVLLSEWCKKNQSTSWGVACFVLKWELNKRIYISHDNSPFDRIFRSLQKNGEELDRTNIPSTSAIREEVPNTDSTVNLECPEVILPTIEEGSVSSLAPAVDAVEDSCPSSDADTDEPEVFLDATAQLTDADSEDPLAIN